MSPFEIKIARYSLSFLWLLTAILSSIIAPDIGFEILDKAGLNQPMISLLTLGGSFLDAIIAFWLLSNWRMKLCYQIQIFVIVIYTLLISIIDSSFWIHPFGPISKNIPILVLIYILLNNIPTEKKPL